MANVTLDMLYKKMQSLHQDIEIVKYALIPVEKITDSERREMNRRIAEMKAGRKKALEDVIAEL